MKRLVIAIDGPSGAGKGTLARALASALGYRHVDTGAMYRAVAWKAAQQGVLLTDDAAVAEVAMTSVLDQQDGRVTIDGEDVTRAIRTPEVDGAAAAVARLPQVRSVLVAQQRALGAAGGVVMEGRDIGTVVFPGAEVKVYLDATPDERARRRAGDAAHTRSAPASVDGVRTAMQARDESDATRSVAPLQIAPDAVYVETTGEPVADVVARVLALVEERAQALR